MKKLIITMFAGLLFASCMNDFDTPQVSTNIVTADTIAPANTTIQQLRQQYASVISGSTYEPITTDVIIEGVVVGNDLSGNIYQQVYIQQLDGNAVDTIHGGISVAIKGYGALYAIFPVGQKIRVNLNGLFIGGYGKLAKIGQPYINTNGALRMGPMAPEYTKTNIMKVGAPNMSWVKAKNITSSDVTSGNIDNITPMLVCVDNCTVPDAGIQYAVTEYTENSDTYSVEHTIKMNDGGKVTLYTSTSATFAGDTIPEGKLKISGILSRYSSSYQLQLRSLDDVQKK